MKNIFVLTLLLLGAITITFAQVPAENPAVSIEDYNRYIDKRMEMNFRLSAMEAMNLTPTEINTFNPIFNKYATAKDRLSAEKFNNLEAYLKDIEKEEDKDDIAEAKTDFIEDFWETEIAEMELKKDYFDVMEDKIPYQKAIDFFLFEETLENGMKFDMISKVIPSLIKIDENYQAKKSVKGWSRKSWKKKPADVTQKEYQLYIDKRMEMDFWMAAIDELALTPDEIATFNPFFRDYMNDKDKLAEKKFELLDDYADEMQAATDQAKRTEESSDFVVDYWELEIEQMKLKEEYFDKMENKLPNKKVAKFFLFEEAVENRMKQDIVSERLPTIIIIEKKKKSNKAANKRAKEMNRAADKMDKATMEAEKEVNQTADKMDKKMDKAAMKAEKEVNQTANKMDKKMDKAATKAEKEVNQAANKMDKKMDKTVVKAEKEVNQTADKMDKKMNKAVTKAEKEVNQTADKIDKKMNKAAMKAEKEVNKSADKMNKNKSAKGTTVGTMTATNSDKYVMSNFKANITIRPFAKEIVSFDNWVMAHQGKMSVDHNYTHDGLKAVVAAIDATADATNTTISGWVAKKAAVLQTANTITINPKAKTHADLVSQAFISIGEAVRFLNTNNEYTYAHGQTNLLEHYAERLDPNVLLFKQSKTVHHFFETANQAIKEIWEDATKIITVKEVR